MDPWLRRTLTSCSFAVTILTGSAGAGARLSAQSVELRGRVVDAVGGQPIANAVVRLPSLRRSALTDQAGSFRLTAVPPGVQAVAVARLGYHEKTVQLDVQPDGWHVIELTPQPIRLDPLVAADQRQLRSLMNGAASARALSMSGAAGPPVFWRRWDRDEILASGIEELERFITKGPPRVGIYKCAGLGAPADRLCVSVPFVGTTRRVTVYLDGRAIGGVEGLERYRMTEIYRVETYGYRAERGIRLYTENYLRGVALGIIRP